MGASLPLAPGLECVVEGRYQLGKAEMTRERQNMGTIKLDGLRLTAGVAYTF